MADHVTGAYRAPDWLPVVVRSSYHFPHGFLVKMLLALVVILPPKVLFKENKN